jgi:hypothetical protein
MARRVGSAKAEKAALRFEAASISVILYKSKLIVKKKFSRDTWLGDDDSCDAGSRRFTYTWFYRATAAFVMLSRARTHWETR